MDSFSKTVNHACRIMSGWKNKYGNTTNKYAMENDGIAFATTGIEGKNNNKKKTLHATNLEKMAITLMNAMKNRHKTRWSRHQTKRVELSSSE